MAGPNFNMAYRREDEQYIFAQTIDFCYSSMHNRGRERLLGYIDNLVTLNNPSALSIAGDMALETGAKDENSQDFSDEMFYRAGEYWSAAIDRYKNNPNHSTFKAFFDSQIGIAFLPLQRWLAQEKVMPAQDLVEDNLSAMFDLGQVVLEERDALEANKETNRVFSDRRISDLVGSTGELDVLWLVQNISSMTGEIATPSLLSNDRVLPMDAYGRTTRFDVVVHARGENGLIKPVNKYQVKSKLHKGNRDEQFGGGVKLVTVRDHLSTKEELRTCHPSNPIKVLKELVTIASDENKSEEAEANITERVENLLRI